MKLSKIIAAGIVLTLASNATAKPRSQGSRKAKTEQTKKSKADDSTTAQWDSSIGAQSLTYDDGTDRLTQVKTGVYFQLGSLPMGLGGYVAGAQGDNSFTDEMGTSNNTTTKTAEIGLGAKAWLPASVVGSVVRPFAKIHYTPYSAYAVKSTYDADEGKVEIEDKGKMPGAILGVGVGFKVTRVIGLTLEYNTSSRTMITDSLDARIAGESIDSDVDSYESIKIRTSDVSLGISADL